MEKYGETQDRHQGQLVLLAGEPLQTARAAMLLLHGRGAGVRIPRAGGSGLRRV